MATRRIRPPVTVSRRRPPSRREPPAWRGPPARRGPPLEFCPFFPPRAGAGRDRVAHSRLLDGPALSERLLHSRVEEFAVHPTQLLSHHQTDVCDGRLHMRQIISSLRDESARMAESGYVLEREVEMPGNRGEESSDE